jgi:hypothetical protein
MTEKKAALCLQNRWAARKCQKDRHDQSDQTTSPIAKCVLYLDFELSPIADPEQLNHGVGERKTAIGGALAQDADLKVLRAIRTESVPQTRERRERHRRTNGPTLFATRLSVVHKLSGISV